MVDSLAWNIRQCGEHNACSEELSALIDIAMYKNSEANFVSRHAEQHLLDLFAQPDVSAATRRQLIDRLFECETILVGGTGVNANEFAMPASLKHLMAQYVHRQMSLQTAEIVTDDEMHMVEGGPAIDDVQLAEMELELMAASKLNDKIIDPNRCVSTDEMLASFAQLPGTHPHVIDLSSNVTSSSAKMQMDLLLDNVPDTGFILAPLLVNAHFMLMAAEKSRMPGKCALTIANTFLSIGGAAIKAVNDPSNQRRLNADFIRTLREAAGDRFADRLSRRIQRAAAGKVSHIEIASNHLQMHAINSCGPLVAMLAQEVAGRKPGAGKVGTLVRSLCDDWRKLKPQQQKDQVLAQRARMMGCTVEWQRAAWSEGRRFVESYAFLPRPQVQTEEATHL
ncbi:MAG TPA: hypothetical protein VGN04_16850 [Herbaspirillum sp.]